MNSMLRHAATSAFQNDFITMHNNTDFGKTSENFATRNDVLAITDRAKQRLSFAASVAEVRRPDRIGAGQAAGVQFSTTITRQRAESQAKLSLQANANRYRFAPLLDSSAGC
jgi:hypothetical protein